MDASGSMPLPPMPLKKTGESIIAAALLGGGAGSKRSRFAEGGKESGEGAFPVDPRGRRVTLGGSKQGFVHFLHFVTLTRSGAGCRCRRSPGGPKGGIARFQSICRLAAHPRFTGREGDTPGCRKRDDEGDNPVRRPLAGAARASRGEERIHADSPVGRF